MSFSKNHVSYDREQREKAKAENLRLFTLSVSHPGGKPFITYQGADNAIAEKVQKFFFDLVNAEKASKP
jgi:hypothetical protein